MPESSPPPPPTPAAGLVRDALARLAHTRPIFHNEADLQHALAWELRADAERIRLELRPFRDEAMFLDMLVCGPIGRIAIELKYVTRRHECKVGPDDEAFQLRDHSAHDLRRYDFIRDIVRLERLLAARAADHAVAVLLTNAAPLWEPPTTPDPIDNSFRLHEGTTLEGTLAWSPRAGPGTTSTRAEALVLNGRYRLSWQDYATVRTGPGSTFRALVVPVAG